MNTDAYIKKTIWWSVFCVFLGNLIVVLMNLALDGDVLLGLIIFNLCFTTIICFLTFDTVKRIKSLNREEEEQ